MSLKIQGCTTMQQNNTAFKCKSKALKILIDPIQAKHIEYVMKSKDISDIKKREFLKNQALRMSSDPKQLLINVFANLKLMFSKKV